MALDAALITTSVIGAVEGFLTSAQRSKEQRAQAQVLKQNIETLQGEIRRGEIELGEALGRIDTLISTAKGELRNVMERQVDQATRDLKQQYKAGLETAMSDIRRELGQRRQFGTEFGAAVRRKTATALTRETAQEITRSRERALNAISQQMTALSLKGGLMKEGKREAERQFRLGALGEIMQLQNLATTLGQQADVSPFLGAIRGAVEGGLPEMVGDIFTPGITEKGEKITSQLYPGAPAAPGTLSPLEDLSKAMKTGG